MISKVLKVNPGLMASTDEFGASALHHAVAAKQLDAVRALLRCGFPVAPVASALHVPTDNVHSPARTNSVPALAVPETEELGSIVVAAETL